MEFKAPYLQAMREQAPRLFNELRKTGALNQHLSRKSAEAHRLFKDLTAGVPKLPSGLPEQPHRSRAEQLVLETLIEFPPETVQQKSDPLSALSARRQQTAA